MLEAKNVRKLLGITYRYCDFSNYDIIISVVEKFCEPELKQRLSAYKDELEKFEKETAFDAYLYATPSHSKRTPCRGFNQIVMKINKLPSECTVHDIRQLKYSIAENALVHPYSVYLETIRIPENSIQVVLHVHPTCMEFVSKSLTSEFMDTQHLTIIKRRAGKQAGKLVYTLWVCTCTCAACMCVWICVCLCSMVNVGYSFTFTPIHIIFSVATKGRSDSSASACLTMSSTAPLSQPQVQPRLSAFQPFAPGINTLQSSVSSQRRVADAMASIESLQDDFSTLMSKTELSLCEKERKDTKFISKFRQHIMSFDKRAIHARFISRNEDDIISAKSVQKLLAILSRCCSYTNYEMILHTINCFCGQELKMEMSKYKKSLLEFEKTTIDVYLCAISAQPGGEISKRFTIMAMEVNKPTHMCTLYEARGKKRAIAECVNLNTSR